MPIYEYQCKSCGHHLEALQKISDEPLTTCPECNKEALAKKVSASAFKLTGSGWYVTDFKDQKSKSSTETKSSAKDQKSSKTTED